MDSTTSGAARTARTTCSVTHVSGATDGWHARYIDALQRYEGVDPHSAEALSLVAEGLREWSQILPLQSTRQTGRPAPANKWGIGPERCMIRAINSYLTQRGEAATVGRLQSEMGDLLDTVEALDSCCMAPCRDNDAIDRLVRTARIQASLLAGFLERIPTHDLPKALRGTPRAKTKAAVGKPARDAEWMAEWRKARGVGGMTRKEFCRQRGIPLEEFLRAQDRHRKRLQSRR